MLFIDGKFHYTDGIPSEAIMKQFSVRNDRLQSVALLVSCLLHGMCGEADYYT